MTDNLQKINLSISPKRILKMVTIAREKKGGGRETLKLINKAIDMTHDYVVNLYFERAHIYQLSYMTERDRLEKGDEGKMNKALKKMEKYTKETEKYVVQNNLDRWFHRLYRFFGKINEYKENYKKAVYYYKRSLRHWKKDPEVVEKGVPRNLELNGFLASALIMSGEADKGLKLARKTYDRYESTKEGRDLKKKDYTTWAIWGTGCVIYAINGLIKGKAEMDKKEVLKWLNEAEKLLSPPKLTKVWADFQFRRDEIKALKRQLGN